ncbi:MAG TPA: hypothetical protein VIU15_22280, partial [Streptomyces sp.]
GVAVSVRIEGRAGTAATPATAVRTRRLLHKEEGGKRNHPSGAFEFSGIGKALVMIKVNAIARSAQADLHISLRVAHVTSLALDRGSPSGLG